MIRVCSIFIFEKCSAVIDISGLPSSDDDETDEADTLVSNSSPVNSLEIKREKLVEIEKDPLDCTDFLAANVLPNCDNLSGLDGSYSIERCR